jgi:NADH-quinone oxidoreductase subunit D
MNVGVITKPTARHWGLSGPVLRGSGIPYDIRCTEAYLGYTSGDLSQLWNVICFNDGDVFARAQVRLWELRESLEICKDLVYKLIDNALTTKIEEIPEQIRLNPDKFILQTVESPQGALSIYLRTDPKKNSSYFYTVRIIPSDLANFAVLEKEILPGNDIRDLPLIIHSMDLNFTMIDL